MHKNPSRMELIEAATNSQFYIKQLRGLICQAGTGSRCAGKWQRTGGRMRFNYLLVQSLRLR